MSPRSMLRRLLAAAALSLSCLLGPAWASDILVPHHQGTAVLPGVPQRVAVFDLGALDTLQALGVEVAAVPGARFPASLARYGDARYAKVGTLFEPDVEALRGLAPDLIVVGGRSARHYAALSEIAPTLDLGADAAGFGNAVVSNTLTLGRVFDRNTEAAALVGRLLQRRAGLGARLGDARALTLFVVGGRANANAPGERFGIVHDLALLPSVLPANVDTAAEGARPEAGSPEAEQRRRQSAQRLAEALAAEPDWLIVLDRGAATGGEAQADAILAADPQVAASRAWREGRVLRLDPPTWYLAPGGIASAQALLDELSGRLADD
ncbi:ABC transporter substrate-binding protein [Luteimonas sp. Y-2-2-4F]|nr:ABC transporter substrate-binding protein [Luteimonas sp. Y-2-2-4F]MCD9032194.1 ABC transporter substrate-binding protein [Luteimonas sp. Y-2-2-4F]